MKRIFRLVHTQARNGACRAVAEAPDGYVVTISEPTRSLEQNAKFHAICSDLADSPLAWLGKRRTLLEWKVLLVSGHAVATKEGSEMVPGLEGEFVNLRESTAAMSKKRGASLIEYALAFCAMKGVDLQHYEQEQAA